MRTILLPLVLASSPALLAAQEAPAPATAIVALAGSAPAADEARLVPVADETRAQTPDASACASDKGDGDGETNDDQATDTGDGDGEEADDAVTCPQASDTGDGDGETNDDEATDAGDGDGEEADDAGQ